MTTVGGGADNALIDQLATQAGASGPNNFNDFEDNHIGGAR